MKNSLIRFGFVGAFALSGISVGLSVLTAQSMEGSQTDWATIGNEFVDSINESIATIETWIGNNQDDESIITKFDVDFSPYLKIKLPESERIDAVIDKISNIKVKEVCKTVKSDICTIFDNSTKFGENKTINGLRDAIKQARSKIAAFKLQYESLTGATLN